jgi:hypothetical protein
MWEQLLKIPGNDHCCDCGAMNPRWASINLGITLCIGKHSNLCNYWWYIVPSGQSDRNTERQGLTRFNPIFLPPAYSPALIYFGQERGWWVTCTYPTVLKDKSRNRKSTTCIICWLKSVLHEEKCREQENHNVG